MKIFTTITLLSISIFIHAQSPSPDQFLDQWHRDAANADTAYFQKIADNGIYLGTDKTERWTKEEFWQFSKPYFEKGQAWDFKPLERHITYSDDQTIAWFDELLDTWMGTARGSGVVQLKNDEWKILHYNLSLPIPNEKMKDVIEVIK